MVLNDRQIASLGLIADSHPENFRAISYDLSVGKVIATNGRKRNAMILKPQGIVEVVSRESVKLPKNVLAYAMVKTSLCNEGILPLNIGIVDPGYEGPISATLLNFGKKPFHLSRGRVFLRLTFHECEESRIATVSQIGYKDYLEDRVQKVLNFDETFLNLKATVETATRHFLTKLIPYASGFALVLALFAFLVTLGVGYVNRGVWSTREDLKSDVMNELRHSELDGLKTEVDNLKRDLEKQKRESPSPTPATSPTGE
jgi:deoxycytidine triphosphate deaminase